MVKNMTTNDFINYMILTIFICVFHVHIFINKMENLNACFKPLAIWFTPYCFKHLPPTYWVEAIHMAAHFLNILGKSHPYGHWLAQHIYIMIHLFTNCLTNTCPTLIFTFSVVFAIHILTLLTSFNTCHIIALISTLSKSLSLYMLYLTTPSSRLVRWIETLNPIMTFSILIMTKTCWMKLTNHLTLLSPLLRLSMPIPTPPSIPTSPSLPLGYPLQLSLHIPPPLCFYPPPRSLIQPKHHTRQLNLLSFLLQTLTIWLPLLDATSPNLFKN